MHAKNEDYDANLWNVDSFSSHNSWPNLRFHGQRNSAK